MKDFVFFFNYGIHKYHETYQTLAPINSFKYTVCVNYGFCKFKSVALIVTTNLMFR